MGWQGAEPAFLACSPDPLACKPQALHSLTRSAHIVAETLRDRDRSGDDPVTDLRTAGHMSMRQLVSLGECFLSLNLRALGAPAPLWPATLRIMLEEQ